MFRRPHLLPEIPSLKVTVSDIRHELEAYTRYGGLPLAYLRETEDDKLREIQLVVERGFDAFYSDGDNISDIIRIALAERHSKEFAYQGIMQSTGIRKRDTINKVIEELIQHGYLLKKRPVILEGAGGRIFPFTPTRILESSATSHQPLRQVIRPGLG